VVGQGSLDKILLQIRVNDSIPSTFFQPKLVPPPRFQTSTCATINFPVFDGFSPPKPPNSLNLQIPGLYLSIPLAWQSIPVYTFGVAFYTGLYLWGGVLYLSIPLGWRSIPSIHLAWQSIPVYTSGVAFYTCLYLWGGSLYLSIPR